MIKALDDDKRSLTKMLTSTMPGEETRTTILVWMVIFVLILSVTMATDPEQNGEVPNNNEDKTDAATANTFNVKYKKECDYYSASSVLNCSNRHPNLINALDGMEGIVQVFDVSNASLTEMIVLSCYKFFVQLKILNASNNYFKELHEETFKGLIYVEKINLSHNKLTNLPDNIFADLIELKFLDISNNFLATLPTGVPMLDWFDASSNQITTLPVAFSSTLYPQRVVLIGGNPFRCDCKIMWLKDWFNTRMYLLKYVTHLDVEKFIPTCFHPENLKNQTWDLLEDSEFKCVDFEEEELIDVKAGHDNEMEIQVSVEDIRSHSVLVRWTGYSKHSMNSIEIRYHKFGKSKDVRKIVIPLTAGSYRLKNMEADTPYIICFSVLPEAEIDIDCEEIVTSKVPQKSSSSMFLIEEVFFYISENIYQIIILFVIVFVTLCVLSHVIFENDNNKVMNDS